MNESLQWCSIDPANTSGIAYWNGSKLVNTSVLRRMGTKGKYAFQRTVCGSRWEAWKLALILCDTVVTEEGMGGFKTAIKSQSGIRGYIEAACDYRTHERNLPTVFKVVNVSEWRRVIKEAYGVSWPATTERKKALSIQLVRDHFGISVTNDEADAVLLGVAAMRMGLVNETDVHNG